MKIVSWNISESKPWKVDHLLGLNTDVLVAPEITCPEKACIPDTYDIKWYGLEYFFHEKKWKGLGIIWKKGNGFVPEWFNPQLEYAIPLIIEDYLKDFKTLVIGDFNCYVNQYDATKQSGDILKVNDLLESYGLSSLYHQQTGEQFGHETKATYFHRFQECAPYFLDYAYTNFHVSSFRLFPWDKEMSDHVGLEVVF